MEIHGTKKLLDAIPFTMIAKNSEEEGNLLFSWHANLLVINRRKTLVLKNDKNRYVVVLQGLKAKDFKKLDELIIEAIRETLRVERVQDEVIDQYLREAGSVTFHKTKNRSMVARLSQSSDAMFMKDCAIGQLHSEFEKEFEKGLCKKHDVVSYASFFMIIAFLLYFSKTCRMMHRK